MKKVRPIAKNINARINAFGYFLSLLMKFNNTPHFFVDVFPFK